MRRSNLMVLLGVAAFVVGVVLVFLVLRDDDGGGGLSPAAADGVSILVATETLDAGTTGDEIIEGRLFDTRRVSRDEAAGVVTSASQLTGARLTQTIVEGDPIQISAVERPERGTLVKVPAGFEAVAVNLDFVGGGGGYVAPGDRVNVYAVVDSVECQNQASDTVPCPYSTPRVELLLTNVEVLDVSAEVAPRVGQASEGARGTGTALTYLLALTTVDVEKVVYQSEFQSLYMTLTADDAPPAGPTPGLSGFELFNEEADDAFARAEANRPAPEEPAAEGEGG